ncbi:hypothetical protein [Streptomyces sp. CFMR 7]|uniref:hypothetical protein n=1 Tax=Streptomyces sp. CFMR 7 TaxID=1649184 RepID=UPI00119EC0F2|nr:hypothetical protein [Streptomyces sp. CFMR 7]
MSDTQHRNGAVAFFPSLSDVRIGIQWTPNVAGVLVTVSGPDWFTNKDRVFHPDVTMGYNGAEPLLIQALIAVLQEQPACCIFLAMVLESARQDHWRFFPASDVTGRDRARLGMS